MTVRASNTFVNIPSGTLLSADAGSDVAIDAGSFNNAGKLQSAGALRVTALGDLINRGTMLALDAKQRGSLLSAFNMENTGTVSMRDGSILMRSVLNNSGLLQSKNMAMHIGTMFANRGRIFADGTFSMQSASMMQIANAGSIEATGDMTLGEANARLGKLSNTEGATLLGRSMQFKGSELENAGLIQGNAGISLDTVGALRNTVKTDKNQSSTKAGVAVRGGFNESHEGTALTGEHVRLKSGGKTGLTNTEIGAKRGGIIDAGKGVEKVTKQDRGQTLNMSASGGSKTGGTPPPAKESKPEWTAAKPASPAKAADAKPGPTIGAARKAAAEKKPVIGHARHQAAAKKNAQTKVAKPQPAATDGAPSEPASRPQPDAKAATATTPTPTPTPTKAP